MTNPADEAGEPAWIEWNGGECPVSPTTPVLIRLRSEETSIRPFPAGKYWWGRDKSDRSYDIIAYRLSPSPRTTP